jgi:hypothetical protein
MERLRISAVITACNEGDEVRKTVESLAASIEKDTTDLQIVLVDDGSADDSCAFARDSVFLGGLRDLRGEIVVVRHETPQGVGRSRNAGYAAALRGPQGGPEEDRRAATGDVLSFHDAHMRFGAIFANPGREAVGAIFANPGREAGAGLIPDPQLPAIGGLEYLAMKALQSDPPSREASAGGGAVICAGSAGLKVIDGKDTPHGCRYWGCDLFHNFQSGLEAKWRHIASDVPPDEWLRSPCMMGAGYVLSRATAERLSGATGALWEDVAGRWGFSEEALSIKAFLLDIPVYFSRDVIFRHIYRGTNPVAHAGTEKWRNICRSTFLLFDRETWEERFKDACIKHLGQRQVEEITNNVSPQRSQSTRRTETSWDQNTEKVFTHLCGKRATVTEPHPDQAWLSQVAEACNRLSKPFSAASASPAVRQAPRQVNVVKVLQWRPGEATVLVRRLLPSAEIVCFEAPGHRASNWAGWCQAHGVHLDQPELGDAYANLPLQLRRSASKPAPEGAPASADQIRAEGFDLILIGGEMQAECRAVAEGLLAPLALPSALRLRLEESGVEGGGIILMNPGAERLQIIDEERRKEEPAASKAQQQPLPQSTQSTPRTEETKPDVTSPSVAPPELSLSSAVSAISAVKKSLVTVCLLNWQRPDNIGPVLDNLRAQTVPLQVYLWNNGAPFEFRAGEGPMRPIAEHPLVKLYIQSSENVGCFPRWALAALADTEFVCSLDDDLAFADNAVLADAIAACREECPEGIVGFFGWVAGPPPDLNYMRGMHVSGIPAGAPSARVDVVKGRFMLMKRAVLERVPLEISALAGISGLSHREDDIYVSLCVSGGKPDFHVIPARLQRRWRELPSHGVAAAAEPGHYERRDEYIRRIRAWLQDSPRRRGGAFAVGECHGEQRVLQEVGNAF